MDVSETWNAIQERVSPEAQAWLCGIDCTLRSEMIAIAGEDGIDAAVEEIEAMAAPARELQ